MLNREGTCKNTRPEKVSNANGIQYIQQVSTLSRKREEKYTQMVDEKGILNLTSGGKKIIIILTMYKTDSELALQLIKQGYIKDKLARQ